MKTKLQFSKLNLKNGLLTIVLALFAFSNANAAWLTQSDFLANNFNDLDNGNKCVSSKTYHIDASVLESDMLVENIEKNSFMAKMPYATNTVFQLFSHGRSGELLLNGEWLNAKEIAIFLNSEFNIKNSRFKTLNIYGCEFAKDEKGKLAVSYLENALGLKVNASINITGKDGDWVLETSNSNTAITVKNYNYNLQTCPTGTLAQGRGEDEDYDGDGICNKVDLDDDNDGILDTDEGYCEAATVKDIVFVLDQSGSINTTEATDMVNGIKAFLAGDIGSGRDISFVVMENDNVYGEEQPALIKVAMTGTSVPASITTYLDNWLAVANSPAVGRDYWASGFQGVIQHLGADLGPNYEVIVLTDGNSSSFMSTRTAAIPILNTGAHLFAIGPYDAASGATPTVGEFQAVMDATYGEPTQEVTDYATDYETSEFDFVPDFSGLGTVLSTQLGVALCKVQDTDNDGIADYLDLDSDGDGCPDAIEGAGSFDADDLETSTIPGGNSGTNYNGLSNTGVQQNLGTTVDTNSSSSTYGVPIVSPATTAVTQAIGDSQTGSTDTECCKNASNYPAITDSDSDGIGDGCDLDDDNDGILDTDEGYCEAEAVKDIVFVLDQSGSISTAEATDMVNGIKAFLAGDIGSGRDISFVVMENDNVYGEEQPALIKVAMTGTSVPASITTYLDNWLAVANGPDVGRDYWASGFQGVIQHLGADLGPNYEVIVLTDGNSSSFTSTRTAAIPILNTGAHLFAIGPYDQAFGATPTVGEFQAVMNATYGEPTQEVTDYATDYETSEFDFVPDFSGLGTVLSTQLGVALCKVQDTDNDGIADYLDLDSDGDGCPDAIEGAGSFDADDLETSTIPGGNSGTNYNGLSNTGVQQNLGTTVDTNSSSSTYGVPIVSPATTAVTQAIGDSQTGSTDTECCKNASNYPAITDSDSDGIGDACDLDDDNDGILDTDEGYCEAEAVKDIVFVLDQSGSINTTEATDMVNGIKTFLAGDIGSGRDISFVVMEDDNVYGEEQPALIKVAMTGTSVPASITTYLDNWLAVANSPAVGRDYWASGFQGVIQHLGADLGPNYEVIVLTDGNSSSFMSTRTAAIPILNTGAHLFAIGPYDQASGATPTVGEFQAVMNATYGEPTQEVTDYATDYETSEFDFVPDFSGLGTVLSTQLGVALCKVQDTDNDGIADYLDLDSDGDGCPDAIEGGGSFSSADLDPSGMPGGNVDTGDGLYNGTAGSVTDNLGSTVDTDPTSTTYGVPTITDADNNAPPQAIGSSQDASVQTEECKCVLEASTDGTPTPSDSDGDGINDTCDLDDDNDGILDVDEGICVAESVYKFDSTLTQNNLPTINPDGGVVDLYFSLETGPGDVNLGNSFSVALTYSDLNNVHGANNTWYSFDVSSTEFEIAPNVTEINPSTSGLYNGLPFENSTSEALNSGMSYDQYFQDLLANGDLLSLGAYTISIANLPTINNLSKVISEKGDVYTRFNVQVTVSSNLSGYYLRLRDQNQDYTGSSAQTEPLETNVFGKSFVFDYTAFSNSSNPANGASSAGGRPAFSLSNIELKICHSLDTDNDGIPNHLDLDSDGDGCPDALEGAGSFTSADLDPSGMPGGNVDTGDGAYNGTTSDAVTDNLGYTSVDTDSTSATYGVPTITDADNNAPPQTIGSSQDVTTSSCPYCILPILTVGTVSCDGATYSVNYSSNAAVTVTNTSGASITGVFVGTSKIIGIPLGTDVILTATNDNCTISTEVTSLADPCDPDCDLPGLVLGQPICGATGEYMVSYTVEDSSATVTITGGSDPSNTGVATALLADDIVISVTNACGTESMTVSSTDLDCANIPCSNPAMSISGVECADDGSEFYTINFASATGTTVTVLDVATGLPVGNVNTTAGTITNIPSGKNVSVTATLEDCTEGQTIEITAPDCPECILPQLTVGTTSCDGTTYSVGYNSNADVSVTDTSGASITGVLVGTGTVTNIPIGTDVILTATNGDCTISTNVTSLDDPCDPDCDLPGLVLGQPICGATGNYMVSYTIEDSSATVTITGGTDPSNTGVATAPLGTAIVISVMNSCGTESMSVNSTGLNCADAPCNNPAISISGTECATDGGEFYMISFASASGTTVTVLDVATGLPVGNVNTTAGTITNLPSGKNVSITATLEDCTEGQTIEITAPDCPECLLPQLTVGTTSCDGTTYSVGYNSNADVSVTDASGASITGVLVGTDSVSNIPIGTDVILTATNGDCTISTNVTSLDDPCDPDCDLPGLVLGQPICGATGEYMVSYTVEDSSATVTITGGSDSSPTGVVTALEADDIVIIVTNACGTESMTVKSDDLDCVNSPCSNPAISISGVECAVNGGEFYMINFVSPIGTTVTVLDVATGLPVGNVDTTAGTITNLPSEKNVTVSAMLDDCTESQSIEITAPTCPVCVLPVLTVGTTSCDGTTYSVNFSSNGTVSTTAGVLGSDSVTGIPLGTPITLTATNGDCTISTNVTSLDDPCDPDCDLPGLVLGQPICGATGEYMVSYTVEDSSATVTITGGSDSSPTGVVTALEADDIVITVTNACGTESMTVKSDDLDCVNSPCSNPAISISGVECAVNGGEFYMINFVSPIGTTVTVLDVATGLPVGNVDTTAGTITNLPSEKNVTVSAMLDDCTESQSIEITAPTCPVCVLPVLTVGTTSCDGTTYSVNFSSNGTVSTTAGVLGSDSVTGIPLGTPITLTATNGDCTISTNVTSLDDPCDPDCDLPGLVLGQPICGATGEYMVSYTVEDSSATVTITGGSDSSPSGVVTALEADDIVISVTNACGTESMTVNSDGLNCADAPCSNPAISISGTECETDGTYTINFTVVSGTSVTTTSGDIDIAAGTVSNIPNANNVTLTATIGVCVTSQSIEVAAPSCPKMSLEKKATYEDTDGNGIVNAGDTINYNFTITNTGNVALTNVTVSDPLLVAPNGSITGGPIAILAVGANDTATFTGSYTIQQSDIDAGSFTNSATVSGTAPDGSSVTDTSDDPNNIDDVDANNDGDPDDPTVTTLLSPMLEITKDGVYTDADTDGVVEAGEIITYTFTVTNTGNIDVTGVSVDDATLGVVGLAVSPTDLSPGSVGTVTFDYVITAADISAGAVYNTATGNGTTTEGPVSADSEDPTPLDPSDPLYDPACPTCTVTVLTNPQMELEKTSSVDSGSDGIINAGDMITYTFTVTNTGNVTLNDITVTDTMLGVTAAPVISPVLSPGQVGTYTAMYEITAADIAAGGVTNTATADGLDPDGNAVTDTSDDPNNIDDVDANNDGDPDDPTVTDLSSPMLEITKEGVYTDADTDGVVEAGEIITYTFTVTNTGNIDVTGVSVDDATLGVVGLAVSPTDLSPGSVGTVTFDYVITAADISAGAVYNTATGNGTTTEGPVSADSEDPTPLDPSDPLYDPACPTCTVTVLTNPQMELEKTSSVDSGSDGIINAGDMITYTFTVTNTGNVTLNDITVTDTMLGVTAAPVVSPVLSPGQVGTYTAMYEITAADIAAGGVTNTATADGLDPDGNAVTDTSDDPNNIDDVDANNDGDPDDPTVTDLSSPMLEITKDGVYTDADTDGVVEAGEIITYTFTVTNTGNIDVTGVSVDDATLGVVGLAVSPTDLSPGSVGTVTFDYVITAADISAGAVYNTATGNGTTTEGPVSADSEDPTPLDPSDPLYDPACPTCTVTVLTNPQMELEKTSSVDSGSDGIINAGDMITYTFTVTNTGNVTLNDITVTDTMLGVTAAPVVSPVLSPGQVGTYTAMYEITAADIAAGGVTNTATADGLDPDGNAVTDTSDDPNNIDDVDANNDGDPDDPTVTDLSSPMLEITKDGVYTDADTDGVVEAGEIITYTFTVTNTGNIDVTGVSVDDATLGVVGLAVSPTDLSPGSVGTVTFDYVITAADISAGAVYNTATGNGTTTEGPVSADSEDPTPLDPSDPLYDPACPTCTVTVLTNPQMELEKTSSVDSGSDGIINAGDMITYTFTVTNTGNVTLNDITVTDTMLGVTAAPVVSPVLSPGQVGTYTAMYEITAADIAAGGVTNTATADGLDPDGNAVTDTSDDPNNIDDVDANNDGDPDDPTVTTLLSPMLEITKDGVYTDADTDGVVEAGEIITYTFTVTNTGNIDVTGVSVDDATLGVVGLAVSPTDLSPGSVGTVTFDYVITAADISAGAVYNTATGNGTTTEGPVSADSEDPTPLDPSDPLYDPACPTCTVTVLTNPQMELEKTSSVDSGSDGIINAGDMITYTFTVTNTGNVTLNDITVTDTMLGVTAAPVVSPVLSPGQVGTYTAMYEITAADIAAGGVTNTATADGLDPDGNAVTDTSDDPNNIDDVDANNDGDPDDPTVTTLLSPMLEITKDGVYTDADTDGVVEAGEIITYTFTVTNTGNIDVTGVSVDDATLGVVGLAVSPTDLSPGSVGTVTFDYVITAADISAGAVYNTATGNGTTTEGPVSADSEDPTPLDPSDPLYDPACPTCTVTVLTNPQMELEKTSSVDSGSDGIINAGDMITYTFTVTNTGNVTLNDITVTDTMLGVTAAPVVSPVLSPGQVGTYTAMYEITAADIAAGGVTNTATADGLDPDGNAVTDTSDDPNNIDDVDANNDGDPDDPTVTTLLSPMLEITKEGVYTDADTDGVVEAGEIITYTFTVTNTGNIDVTGVSVDDATLGVVGLAVSPTDLSPGSVGTVTFDYVITAADISAGAVYNTATGNGTTTEGPVSADSEDPTPLDPSDPLYDPACPTCTVTVLTNPQMELEKTSSVDSGSDGIINAGDMITYTFTVTNTGNVTLNDITVTDTMLGVTAAPVVSPVLSPGQVGTYTAMYEITAADIAAGGVTNTATADGLDPDGNAVTDTSDDPNNIDDIDANNDGDPDDPTVTILLSPMLGLEKEASYVDTDGNSMVNVGDIINYSFTVTNTGNVDITGITISDPLLVAPNGSITGGPIDLVAGASDTTTFTGSYTITVVDITNGSVENSATVSGIASNGVTVEDTSDDPSDSTNVDTNGDGEPDDVTVFIVPPYNDIELTKTIADGNMTPVIGSNITFVIAVTNNGPSPATGVEVLDLLPSGYTYVNHTASSGVYASGTGMWTNLDDLPVGASQTLTVIATVLSSGDYNNIAEVMTADEQDIDSVCGNGILSEDDMDRVEPTPVAEIANLSITKAVLGGDLAAEPGDEITFVITVNNAGPNDATGVSVQELLPSGFQYIDSDTASGSYDPTTGLWSNLDTIPVNTSVQLTVDVLVLDSGDYTNYVQIMTSDQADPNSTPGDNSTGADDDDVVSIEVGQLYVIKTGEFADENGDDYATVGEAVTYEIEVHNDGDIALSSVMLTDANADAGSVTYVSGDDNTNDILDIGEVWYYTAVHTITQADIDAGSVTNTAIASGVTPGGTTVIDESDDASPFEDDATVTVLPTCGENLIVHNVITPNDGDQVNDVFVIANIACAPDNTVQIFNRWGVLVYETENYGSNGNYFNGTSEGRVNIQNKELPVGTYYYVIDYVSPSGANKSAAGYLYIQR